MGSHHKKKKGTDDVRIVISDIKKDQDQDAMRTVLQTGLELISPGSPRVPFIRNCIDFVNVIESIGPSQTNAPTPPAQITGLNVTVIGNNQLNLTWTASTDPNLTNYKIYRSTTSGAETLLNTSVTNSYSDLTVFAGTTYYYKVSAVSNAGEGTLSVEDSATTTGTAPLIPMLELNLNGNFIDTSPNSHATLGNNGNGFLTPGQFGDAWKCNYPLAPPSIPAYDLLYWNDHLTLRLNTSVGFSFSIWVYPVTFGVARKWLILKADNANNEFVVAIEPSTLIVQFHVKKAGTDYKRQTSTGLTVNSWNHVAGIFNGSTNTIEVYKNAVAGAVSTATTSYQNTSTNFEFKVGDIIGGPATIDNKIQGYIDEIKYYQLVLTPTQITNLKNTNTP